MYSLCIMNLLRKKELQKDKYCVFKFWKSFFLFFLFFKTMVSALSYKPFLLVLRSQFQSHEINLQTQNTFWETNTASGEQESNHGSCIIIFFVVNAWMARRVCVWSCRRTASDSLSSSQGHRNFLLWLMPWRNSERNLYGT